MKRTPTAPRTEEARQLLLPAGPVPLAQLTLPAIGPPGVVIGCRRVRGRCSAFVLSRSPELDAAQRVVIPAALRIEGAVYGAENLETCKHHRPHYRPVGALWRIT